MVVSAELLVNKRQPESKEKNIKAKEEYELRWWEDRIAWPKLPRIDFVLPALYDRHITYESGLDFSRQNPSRISSGITTDLRDLPRNFFQRLLFLH